MLRRRVPSLVSLGIFVAAGAAFAYRGWAARDQMMYLDEVFVGEALQPRLVVFRGFTNEWGETVFLQPFSGYLHTVVRALIELILLGPLSHYPTWTFALSTMVWTACALLLYFAVRDVVGVVGGVIAAIALPLLHVSNIILLGQLNALQHKFLQTGSQNLQVLKQGLWYITSLTIPHQIQLLHLMLTI